ncbi:SpoIIE family protein phosphatase [Streptomyces sp. NPDC101733]|uniref:SpoIIE family protein phosphatase n=1 Tax=unclassified Streptomyces TaxID=2593676 RepID=UPI00381C1066
MNRFARLATRLLSASQGLVWLNPPGEAAGASPEYWPAGLPVAPSVLECCRHVAGLGQPRFLPVAGDGAIAFAGVPLVGGAGELLGVLAVVDAAPRAWSGEEVRDLTDLAGACSAQIRMRMRSDTARQARDEAEDAAYAAEGEATRMQTLLSRSQLLLRAAEDLADTSGLDDVRRQVGDLVGGDLKPSYIGLVLLHQGMLHRVADSLDGDVPFEDVPSPYPLDLRWPTARATRENHTIVINDRTELAAAYGPEAVAGFDALGLHTATCLPLRGTRGTLGALVLGWSSPYRMDVAERAVLTTIAAYTAQAVERALHLDERVTAARELQQAMLTDLPSAPGLELAALYRPAAQDDMVGGDWYDAYPLPAATEAGASDSLAISVGDITGHDMQAAAVMGQVRSMLRQADHDHAGKGPEVVLSALEGACRRLGLPFGGTLVHAHLHSAADGHRLLTWSNAGHPPPLLASPDGAVEQLKHHDVLLHPSLPLLPRTCEKRLLAPGSTLLLYSDGLVEERGRNIDENIGRVARRLSASPPDLPLEALLRSLVGAVTARAQEAEDDTVLLALRVPALERPGPQ